MKQASERKKSIVISGYYGYRNLGDDAILEMICRDYADEYELTVLTLRPLETAKQYPVKTVHRFRLIQVIRAIRNADLLISGGGSLLQDKTSTRSLLYYLLILKIAQFFAVPSMLYACGIGPIRSGRNQRRTADVLRNVDCITLRDPDSAALLQRLCPGRKCFLTSDPVFRMTPSQDSAADALLKENHIPDTPLFAVALRKTDRSYLPRIAELLDRTAVMSGCTPVFLSMQEPADAKAAQAVRCLMREPSFLLSGCRSGPDMIAVLRRMRGIVSMRLHALIFGAAAEIPVIGIDEDPKIAAVLRSLKAPGAISLKSLHTEEEAAFLAESFTAGKVPGLPEQAAEGSNLPDIVHGLLDGDKRGMILHVISGGDIGGAKMHVLNLLQGLLLQGCRILLVCFMEGPFAADARAAGIPVKVLPRDAIAGNLAWLMRCIRRNGVQAVHCHGARGNLYGALLSSRVRIPVITTIHSDPELDYLGRPAADALFGRINRRAIRKIGWHICVSEELRGKMAAMGVRQDRLFLIHNGLSFDHLPQPIPRDQWFERLGVRIPEDAVVFGTAARLTPVKDIATLIAAFSAVVKRHPHARLLIAGEGSEGSRLRDAARASCPENTVFFTGWLDDMDPFYQAVDVNVITSLSEGFPYAIQEGGRMRCATIATRVGGIPSVIRDGETGFLLEPGDTHALAERMCRMIDEPELRRKMGDALHDRLEQAYSMEKMIRTQMEIYQTIRKSQATSEGGEHA